ncbi:TRAP transporter substrate-binding protein DctP [Hoeflea sp.]|uniref:TRAP transporter substrate-binding protein DctP n=1 Tax=Hoeflea sp. TaxID=1940281 RepID=UPI003A8F4296
MMKTKAVFLKGIAAVIATGTWLATPLAAEEVTLRGVSCFPIGAPPGVPFEHLVTEINEKGKSVIQINLLGGAPAIGSPFQVVERMAQGAYDIAGCPEAFFGNLIPEAPVLRLQEKTFAELRDNGGINYFQEIAGKKNVKFVGRHHDDGAFNLFLGEGKAIDKADLTGLNLRVSPVYTAFFKALGATVQRSSMPEVYTLMESGAVDGYGWSVRGVSPSWFPVTKYRVEPGVYRASIHTVANLAKWNSLSDEARAILNEVVIGWETRIEGSSDYAKQLDAETFKMLEENGIETITLEGEEAEKWVDAARETAWAEFIEQNPETGPKLKELFTVSD